MHRCGIVVPSRGLLFFAMAFHYRFPEKALRLNFEEYESLCKKGRVLENCVEFVPLKKISIKWGEEEKMHSMKRRLAALVSMLFVIALLAGCGGPKVSPEETTQILADACVKLDFKQADKVGLKKDMQEKIENAVMVKGRSMLKAKARTGQIQLTDEQAQKVLDAAVAAQRRSTITTKLISKDSKAAVVEVSLTAIDGQKMAQAIMQDMQAKVQGMTQAQFKKDGGAIITGVMVTAMNNVVFKQDPVVLQVKCKIDEKENIWVPEEGVEAFGKKLNQIVGGTGA